MQNAEVEPFGMLPNIFLARFASPSLVCRLFFLVVLFGFGHFYVSVDMEYLRASRNYADIGLLDSRERIKNVIEFLYSSNFDFFFRLILGSTHANREHSGIENIISVA